MPDHIHAFLSCPQTVAPADIARTLKSITAIRLFQEYPQLKQFYARTGTLWSKGYFITTVGNASATTIQHYIENQKASDPTR
jgi:putative transposase